MQATIKIRNLPQVQKRIQKAADFLRGSAEFKDIVGVEGVKGIRRNIYNAQTPGGMPWKPIRNRSGRPLRDKGLLYNSFTYSHLPGGTRIGTADEKAATHHYGDPNRRAKKGGYMAIPVNQQMRRLYTGSWRTIFPDAFVLATAIGNRRLWLVRKMGKQDRSVGSNSTFRFPLMGRLQFIALLVKKVSIPARPFMGFSAQTWGNILKRTAERAKMMWG